MKGMVKITIKPSDSEFLPMKDTFRQVWDCIDLLEAADRSLDKKVFLHWRLANVMKTNPLVLEVEPYGIVSDIDVDHYAGIVFKRFYDGMSAVLHDSEIPAWIESSKKSQDTLKRILTASGRTDLELGENSERISIDQEVAESVWNFIEQKNIKKQKSIAHGCHGSVEGIIEPLNDNVDDEFCVGVRPRQGGKVVCFKLSQNVVRKIGTAQDISDEWGNKRVFVEGYIEYDTSGEAHSIEVKAITGVEEKDIILDDLFDPDFTGGLPVGEYQERLREGTLGD